MKTKEAAVKKLKSIHNKDAFQRVNFLHQASLMMADTNRVLSCYYGNLFKQIQKKAVLKIDPSMKRDLCRKCSIGLTPATSEISPESDSLVTIECKNCNFEKKYTINDNYKLWSEKVEAIEEILEIAE